MTVFAQFIVNIWPLFLKLLPIGLSTALGSLQTAKQSWIHYLENWVGEKIRGAFKEFLLHFSHFTIKEYINQGGSDLTKIIQVDHGRARLEPAVHTRRPLLFPK